MRERDSCENQSLNELCLDIWLWKKLIVDVINRWNFVSNERLVKFQMHIFFSTIIGDVSDSVFFFIYNSREFVAFYRVMMTQIKSF